MSICEQIDIAFKRLALLVKISEFRTRAYLAAHRGEIYTSDCHCEAADKLEAELADFDAAHGVA